MIQPLKLSASVQTLLRCPACKSELTRTDDRFSCINPACYTQFPTVAGAPVLINEKASVFSTDDFVSLRQTTLRLNGSSIAGSIKRFLPRLGGNNKAKQNYQEMAGLLLRQSPNPTVLIIGGSILGDGTEALLAEPRIELVESDVSFGPRTQLISDAHEIPFADGTFDAVVVQAVLHCLTDPDRCVGEIHRVLKKDGMVYAETAFMQQVIDAPYDFTRFTYFGLRRLFRHFDEVKSGVVAGPGTALAWSCQFFLLSFARSRFARGLIRALCHLSLFWIKYFDYYLADSPGAFDAASGFYFMGRRSEGILGDRDLVRLCRGSG